MRLYRHIRDAYYKWREARKRKVRLKKMAEEDPFIYD